MSCEDCKNYEPKLHKICCVKCKATNTINDKAFRNLRECYNKNPLYLLDLLLQCDCDGESDWMWVI